MSLTHEWINLFYRFIATSCSAPTHSPDHDGPKVLKWQNKSLFLKFYLSGTCDQDVESSTLLLLPVSLFSATASCWIKFLLGKYDSQFSLSTGYRIT